MCCVGFAKPFLQQNWPGIVQFTPISVCFVYNVSKKGSNSRDIISLLEYRGCKTREGREKVCMDKEAAAVQ